MLTLLADKSRLLIHSLAALITLTNLMAATVSADTRVPICPDSPNCVSSQERDMHHIEPFAIKGDGSAALSRLRDLLAGRNDTELVRAATGTVVVEFHTILGFVDDAIFILDRKEHVIHVYSAARTGYWDLGKNRRRIEEIREEFEKGEKR